MFLVNRKWFVSFLSLYLLLVGSQIVLAQDKEWREVSPAELAMKTPTVEPDADAEAMFWEVRVDDSSADELALKHYIRIKVFTECGRNRFSKVDIAFSKGMKVKDVAARIIKTDGTIVELKKEDVFEREISKSEGKKVKAKSFAFPNIESGVILEYRYREVIDNAAANMRLIFQRDIPIQRVTYYVRPFNGLRSMLYHAFNMNGKFEKDKDGFYRAQLTNVPSFKTETQMPPEDETRSWMYIYYSRYNKVEPKTYWLDWSKYFYTGSEKKLLKVNGEIEKKAAEIVKGANSDEEKLKRIYEFCKSEIRNITYEVNPTEIDRKKVEKAESPSKILEMGMGNSAHIDFLYGALAKAAGFDARMVLVGDRSEIFFKPQITNFDLMLGGILIAVKIKDQWLVNSPGTRYSTFGMLNWWIEGQQALVSDDKELIWIKIPLSAPEKSIEKRTGKFNLLEDGTLEGDVHIEYTGHLGAIRKASNDVDSQLGRETDVRNEIKRRISTAEVSNITVENVTDPEKPFVYSYRVRVPNYAQKTGKRLFFQPGFFEYGENSLFSAAARKYDIYFNYPWSEADDIEIQLPKGFTLDSADAPSDIADPKKIGSLNISMGVDKASNTFIYKRKFHFGGGSNVLFPATVYQPLKNLFDAFQKADAHTITLKQN